VRGFYSRCPAICIEKSAKMLAGSTRTCPYSNVRLGFSPGVLARLLSINFDPVKLTAPVVPVNIPINVSGIIGNSYIDTVRKF